MPGKLRKYTWILKRPVSPSSSECERFNEYVRGQIFKSKHVSRFENNSDSKECVISAEMECWSYGKVCANKFRKNILTTFPDADLRELARIR